jgi:hypothetical protein
MRSFFRMMPVAALGIGLTVSAQTPAQPQTQTPTTQDTRRDPQSRDTTQTDRSQANQDTTGRTGATQDQTQTGTTRGTADMPATSANWLAMVLGGGVLAGAGLAARRRR